MFSVGYLPFCVGSMFEGNQQAVVAYLPSSVTDQQISDRVDLGENIYDILGDVSLGTFTCACSINSFGESWADVNLGKSGSFPYNRKIGVSYTFDYESYLNASGVQSGAGVQATFVGHTFKRQARTIVNSASERIIYEQEVRDALPEDPSTLDFSHYGISNSWSYMPEEEAEVGQRPPILIGLYSVNKYIVRVTELHVDLGEVKTIDRVAMSFTRNPYGATSAAFVKVVAWSEGAWVDLASINVASITDGNQKYVFECTPVQAQFVTVIGYGSMPSSYPSSQSRVNLHMFAVGDSGATDSPTVVDRAIVVSDRVKKSLINLNISDKPSYAFLDVVETGNFGDIVLQSKTVTGNKIPVIESVTMPFGVKP